MAKFFKTIDAELFDGTVESVSRIKQMVESLYPGWRVELGQTLYAPAAHVYKPNGVLWCTASNGNYIVCPEPQSPGSVRPEPFRRDRMDFESRWRRPTD